MTLAFTRELLLNDSHFPFIVILAIIHLTSPLFYRLDIYFILACHVPLSTPRSAKNALSTCR